VGGGSVGAVVVLLVPGDEVVVWATLSLELGDDKVVEVVAPVVVVVAPVVVVVASDVGGTVGSTLQPAIKMAWPLGSFQFSPGKCPPV
jgi:hypothetical protein